jgi:hypothetical protein
MGPVALKNSWIRIIDKRATTSFKASEAIPWPDYLMDHDLQQHISSLLALTLPHMILYGSALERHYYPIQMQGERCHKEAYATKYLAIQEPSLSLNRLGFHGMMINVGDRKKLG